MLTSQRPWTSVSTTMKCSHTKSEAKKWKLKMKKLWKAEFLKETKKKSHKVIKKEFPKAAKKWSCSKAVNSSKTKTKSSKLTTTTHTAPTSLTVYFLKKFNSLTPPGMPSTSSMPWTESNPWTVSSLQILFKITKKSSSFCGKSNASSTFSNPFGLETPKSTLKHR